MSRTVACLVLPAVLLITLALPAIAATSEGTVTPRGTFDPLWHWLQVLRAADGGMVDPFGIKSVASPKGPTAPRVPVGAHHRATAEAGGLACLASGSKS
jgi:hypothetical protein